MPRPERGAATRDVEAGAALEGQRANGAPAMSARGTSSRGAPYRGLFAGEVVVFERVASCKLMDWDICTLILGPLLLLLR